MRLRQTLGWLSSAPGLAKGTEWTGAMLATNDGRASRKQTASKQKLPQAWGGWSIDSSRGHKIGQAPAIDCDVRIDAKPTVRNANG